MKLSATDIIILFLLMLITSGVAVSFAPARTTDCYTEQEGTIHNVFALKDAPASCADFQVK